MGPLKILITNSNLEAYSGTTVVVRDLAFELRRQGHQPLIYAPRLGPVAEEIRASGIEVVQDLDRLTNIPDVIHGQHHHQVLEALLHFPAIPAIYLCNDATAAFDEPFYFPRILKYVAVDARCRKRIEDAADIPPSLIDVIWNSVDLTRFERRDPLPQRPRRALVFSNYANRFTHLPAVRKLCRQGGLELDVVGINAGTQTSHPESILPRYDLVFAKARCALEAMAAGCAVILCDFAGTGPMVTSENFDRLRPLNFGRAALANKLKAEHLRVELDRYDPGDAGRVCERVRSEASLSLASRQWVALYSEVLERFRASEHSTNNNIAEEFRAVACYLHKWSYQKRVDWEKEQVYKLKRIPIVGESMFQTARWAVGRWSESS